MKVSPQDLEILRASLKGFKAGVIDEHLDRHIDQCFRDFRELIAIKQVAWWQIWK